MCSIVYRHFIITLFNVGNILLCVIYQINFTVFVYVTRISRYHVIYSVEYYLWFHVTAVGLGMYNPHMQGSTCIVRCNKRVIIITTTTIIITTRLEF